LLPKTPKPHESITIKACFNDDITHKLKYKNCIEYFIYFLADSNYYSFPPHIGMKRGH